MKQHKTKTTHNQKMHKHGVKPPARYTLVPVGHNQDIARCLQCQGKRWCLGRLKHRTNIQVLRVRKHATPCMFSARGPRPQNFWEEFKDAFLPGMTDEQMAIQTIWIHHQRPTHFSSLCCNGFDILLVHYIDARTKFIIVFTLFALVITIATWRGQDEPLLNGTDDLLP